MIELLLLIIVCILLFGKEKTKIALKKIGAFLLKLIKICCSVMIVLILIRLIQVCIQFL